MGIVFGLLTVLWLLLTLVLRLERRGEDREAARTEIGASPAVAASPAVGASPEQGASSNVAASLAVAASQAVAASVVGPGSVGPAAVRIVGAPADLEPALVAAIGVVILRHTETRRRQAAPAMRSYWPGSLLFASRWVASGRTRQSRSWTRRAR
jgi:Na+-transporting methylmalonyl-CoA/oxaloacetate decarboxylase gamma subunit